MPMEWEHFREPALEGMPLASSVAFIQAKCDRLVTAANTLRGAVMFAAGSAPRDARSRLELAWAATALPPILEETAIVDRA